jgi:recombinational DNA repair protein RecR
MYNYQTPDDPQTLRETLKIVQGMVGGHNHSFHHVQRLQNLIDACDRALSGIDQEKFCRICQGLIRETINMVCETCGRDYRQGPNPPATKVF